MARISGLLLCAALAGGCAAEAVGLPFYADRTFTPSWVAVPHSVTAHPLADTPFVDQTGAALSPADLKGRVHVASFIFTRCASICPPLVSSLKKVQAATAEADVLLVSYSIDPVHDTSIVLAEFGRSRGIDSSRWKLLSGTPEGARRVARDLYFADDDGLRPSMPEPDTFLHTEKLLLVDADGHIRGVYNGTQPFEVQKLIDDLETLDPGPSDP